MSQHRRQEDEEDEEDEKPNKGQKHKDKTQSKRREEEEEHEDEEEEEEEEVEKKEKSAKVLEVLPEIRITGLTRILDYLYLAEPSAAAKKEALQDQKIEVVINCTEQDVDNFFPEDFKYHSYEMTTGPDSNISQFFEEIYDIIKAAKVGWVRGFLCGPEN